MSQDRYSVGIHAHAQVHVHDAADIRADELSGERIVVRLGGQCDLFFDSRNAVYEFCGALMDLFPVLPVNADVNAEPIYAGWGEPIEFTATDTPWDGKFSDNRGDDEGDEPRGEYLPPDESLQPPTYDELPIEEPCQP